MIGKKLGILGGMGSQATAYFFDRVVKKTVADLDQEHIDMFIYNHATLPDRTKIILSGDYQEFLSKVIEDLKLLESVGAENIAIPCNTTHCFIDEIQTKIGTPITNMVKESVNYAKNNFKNVKKIGILATDGTLQARTYENEFKKNGIGAIALSSENQKKIMSIIYDEIKQGKKGNTDVFNQAISELREKGSDVIIIACTELSYLKEQFEMPDYCIDALEILVMRSIEVSGKKYKF